MAESKNFLLFIPQTSIRDGVWSATINPKSLIALYGNMENISLTTTTARYTRVSSENATSDYYWTTECNQ
jgi:hypothetical protein